MARKSRKQAVGLATEGGPGKGSGLANIGMGLITSEIVLRSVGRLTRHTVEKAVARRNHNPSEAKAIVENRGFLHTMAAFGVSRIATRSVPGALLVGGGLLAKPLFDRGSAKRKSRKGAKQSAGTKSAK